MNETLHKMINGYVLLTALSDTNVSDTMYRSLHAAKTPTREVYYQLLKDYAYYTGQNQTIYYSHLSELNKSLYQQSADYLQLYQLEKHITELEYQIDRKNTSYYLQHDTYYLETLSYQRMYEITNAYIQLDDRLYQLEKYTQYFEDERDRYEVLLQKFMEQSYKIKQYVLSSQREKIKYQSVIKENEELRNELSVLKRDYSYLETQVNELYRDRFPEEEEQQSESENLNTQIENGSVITSVDDMDESSGRKRTTQKRKIADQRPAQPYTKMVQPERPPMDYMLQNQWNIPHSHAFAGERSSQSKRGPRAQKPQ